MPRNIFFCSSNGSAALLVPVVPLLLVAGGSMARFSLDVRRKDVGDG